MMVTSKTAKTGSSTDPTRCPSCGALRNHYVDGKLRPKCVACNERKQASFSGLFGVGKDVLRARMGMGVEPTSEAVELLRLIDELLEDEAYAWAEDTLSGIQQTVERSGTCSPAQRRAVENIENARSRGGRR